MLPKEKRLRHMKDYEILFKEGRFLVGNLINLKFWQVDPNKYPRRKYSTEETKIGFIVSTKVDKRAVYRNRVKRQMREVVRLLLKEGKIQPGFLAAFIAKPNIIGSEYREIEQNIVFLLKKAGMLD